MNRNDVHQVQYEQGMVKTDMEFDNEPNVCVDIIKSDELLPECDYRHGKCMVEPDLDSEKVNFEWDTGATVSKTPEPQF